MASTKRAAAAKKPAAGKKAVTLPGAPKGKVSAAPVAEGDAPVKAYIATLPSPHKAIVQAVDRLAGATIPGLRRGIKWGMPFYGNDLGWFASCGAFKDHVKVNFFHGTKLKPVPPAGKAKYVRSVDLERLADLDKDQVADWLRQASAMPGLGAGK